MKVPCCYECRTADGLVPGMKETKAGSKSIWTCTFCGNTATSIHEERLVDGILPTTDVGKVLGDFNSASSYAVRSFTSPLGRIQMNVSTNSNFCHWITVDGAVSKSLKRFIDEDCNFDDTFAAVVVEFSDRPTQVVQTLERILKIIKGLHQCVNNVVELDLDFEGSK